MCRAVFKQPDKTKHECNRCLAGNRQPVAHAVNQVEMPDGYAAPCYLVMACLAQARSSAVLGMRWS